MENQPGFIVILIFSILLAWQIRNRNRIDSFQKSTSYQRYQSPIPPLFINIQLLLFSVLFFLQFVEQSTTFPIFAFCHIVIFCYHIFSIIKGLINRKKQSEVVPDDPQKLRDVFSGGLLIVLLWLAYFVQSIEIENNSFYSVLGNVSSSILGYLVHITLCYTVLLLLLPLLRKCINARVCGYLWTLPLTALPLFHLGLSMKAPMLLIHTPLSLTIVIVIIWAAGFVGILLWYLFSHQYFRKKLLKNATPIQDAEIQQLWQQILMLNYFKAPQPQLLYSPDIATPLSIGSNVFLPQKEYTQEELRLIFYHELIHFGRFDVGTKFTFSLLAAFFWFNPLMWIALRRITEDMELSCDETTLLWEEDATRHRYAELLLRTAGSHLGFSTCLSASAKSLRYRLKNTLKPAKKASGYIIAGLFCMACLLFQGSIAFTYNHNTGAECFFASAEATDYTVSEIHTYRFRNHSGAYVPPLRFRCSDSNALFDYLCGLELYHITGNYYDDAPDIGYTICYTYEEGKLFIDLLENIVEVAIDTADRHERYTYYHGGSIDWEYLLGLFEPYEGGSQESSEDTIPVETQPKEPPALPWHK